MVGKKRGGRSEWEERGLPLSRGKPPLVGVRRGRVHSSLDAPFLRRPGWLGREARGSVGGKGEIAFSTIAFSLPLVPGGRRGKMRPRRPRENYVERGFLFHYPFSHQGLFYLMKIATVRPVCAAGYKVAGVFRLFREVFLGASAHSLALVSSLPFLPFGRGCIVSAFSPLPSPRGPFCFRHSSLAFIGEEGNGRCREERRERWQSEVREKPSSSSAAVCVCHTAAAKGEEEEKEEKCIGGEESRQGNKVGREEKKEEEKGLVG